jgi:membrane protease YdiL (CAAX protease family)/Tfp pilus assembly protein PilF
VIYSDESGQSNPGVEDLLQAGIAAARSGHADWARDLLLRAVELDAENVQAWLWLSRVTDRPAEARRCLEKVLSLAPEHAEARRRLEELEGREGDPTPARFWAAELEADEPVPAEFGSVKPVLAEPCAAAVPPAGSSPVEARAADDYEPEVEWDVDEDWAPEPAGAEEELSLPVVEVEDTGSAGWADSLGDAGLGPDGPHRGEQVGTLATPSPGVEVVLDAAPSPEVDDLMREGIAAARSQQPERARHLLQQATEVDAKHVSAWLWLSYVAESAEERARYVQKVLSLAVSDAAPRPALAGALAGPLGGMGFAPAQAPAYAPRPSRSYAPATAPAGTGTALPSEIVDTLRTAYAEWTSTWTLTAVAYMAGITVAELLTTFVPSEPRLGLAAHALLLLALFAHAALVDSKVERGFLVCLAFAPLIRVLSLSMPLAELPILYWYLITSIPLFAALLVAAPVLGYSWIDLGLNLRRWPQQVAIGLTGIVFGAVEYLILQPDPLAPSLQLVHLWWPALILMVSTGLLEEMIFRGLLQRAAGEAMRRGAVAYVALLFAVLHIGYRSWGDFCFVLLVGLFFGEMVQRTRSLVGVTLSHGLTNIVLFLVMPFLGWP